VKGRLRGWLSPIVRDIPGGSALGLLTWACALGTTAYIAWSFWSFPGVLAAVTLPLLLVRLPVAGLVLIAVVAEEITANGDNGFMSTFGNQLFFAPGKVPILLPLAATAALALVARSGSFREWCPPRTLFVLAALPVVVAVGIGLVHGQPILSAANQNARPYVLLCLGVLVGFGLRDSPRERQRLVLVVVSALSVLVLAAIVSIVVGSSADSRVSRYFIYYDSALAAVGAAVFIGLVSAAGWRWDARRVGFAVALVILVIVSFRRSIWIAGGVTLAVTIVATWWSAGRPRMLGLRRSADSLARVGAAGALAAVIVMACPGFAADVGLRSATVLPADSVQVD